MGVTSACIRQMKDVGLSDPSKVIDGPSGTECFSGCSAGLVEETTASGECSASSVAKQIEHSKTHWSILAKPGANDDEQLPPRRNWRNFIPCCSNKNEEEEVAEVSNVEVFKALQSHPTWGDFFYKFNQGEASEGWSTLEVGEKFAEGGQAELFHAKVTWGNPKKNELDLKEGTEWALKVFKKGTFLRDLQYQLPQGLLHFHAEEVERWKSPTAKSLPRYFCAVYQGTLLEDGRFAFLMVKEHFDLRTLIERNMKLRTDKEDCGPFSKEDAEFIMFLIALGVEWLHCRDIVHRDLKASNVLVKDFKSGYPKWSLSVADYECSIGVVGTGFFRAPEILQVLKDRKLSQRPEVFSKASDVYGYGMTCYEILTGKLPFEGHPQNDYDFVINGQHPVVPEYVEDWTRELLSRCWNSNPEARPEIGEILKLLLANSKEARKCEEGLKKQFGENFKIRHDIESSNL